MEHSFFVNGIAMEGARDALDAMELYNKYTPIEYRLQQRKAEIVETWSEKQPRRDKLNER